MIKPLLENAIVMVCLFTIATAFSNSSDGLALLAFKSKADLKNKLHFSPNASNDHCKWEGVKCVESRVVHFIIQGLNLGGIFSPNSVSLLDQLRVLSLQNNSLTGPIPSLVGLIHLKALFLDHNSFTGSIPPSISSLLRLKTLFLSYNKLTGPLPLSLTKLDRLYYLRLDNNHFNGSIPPFNQSSLLVFNVSSNNLTGPVPETETLLRFSTSSFTWNPGLCGEIIKEKCRPSLPFFDPYTAEAPPPAVGVGQLEDGVELTQESPRRSHNRSAIIVGFSTGVFVLIGSIICFFIAINNRNTKEVSTPEMGCEEVMRIEDEKKLEMKKMEMGKSGNLVFCAGESQLYTFEQLMRGSAELLGRGTMGTTYKAILDNRLIVCVKRLDATKLAGTSKEFFEQHMESVGGLRHPNLVPLRAYFQSKNERFLVYDFQPNGNLFSLMHGSKLAKAKPLHWTSCLKIAEDVAQGLSYIHQAWRLVHGNLKSSNVLLGPDFEACLSDYCLSALTQTSSSDKHHPDSAAYKAPETLKLNHQATSKSDVYSFGILVFVLLAGKPPPKTHQHLLPDDLINWVRSSRDENDNEDNHRLVMMVEVAIACSMASAEQRPTMWQVLKMIQEIKEAVMMEDC